MRALFVQSQKGSAATSSITNDLTVTTQASEMGASWIGGDVRPSAATPSGLNIPKTPSFNISSTSNSPDQDYLASDVIDRDVLSWKFAEKLFYLFVNDLFPHYPCIYFKPGTLPEEIRRKKPVLFLAVMAAAAGKVDPHLYSVLHSEVVMAYTQKAVINNEKSLELVQAELITSIWYYPPGRFSKLKYYEYIHMATTSM